MNRTKHRSGFNTLRSVTVISLMIGVAGVVACAELVDVENPNNVSQEDLDNPAAATALVNGALSATARAYAQMLAPYATAGDELTWIGSRQGWLEIDQGNLSDPLNEFVDGAFPFVNQARWMSDEAITLLEEFDSRGELENRRALARAYFYGGIIYSFIADMFDDFVLSDRQETSPPLGPENMDQMYGAAISYLDKALPIAEQVGDSELQLRILAVRARAKFARNIWEMLNPTGSVPADPLVNDASAQDDAREVISRIGPTTDWRFQFSYSSATITSNIGFQINERQELRFGDRYATFPGSGVSTPTAVPYQDPVDEIVDPVLSEFVFSFVETADIGSLTVVSAREMHLILAETALASGSPDDAVDHMNRVRAMNMELSPYVPPDSEVTVLELLKHERIVNLFLQGRRLTDLYRFGDRSDKWQSTSEAAQQPGTLFPITAQERRANPHIP